MEEKAGRAKSVADNRGQKYRYCDNTDKKRSSRPLVTAKADLQVAQFLSILDIRFVELDRNFEILVRARHDDGDIARSWISAGRLDFSEDEESENKLVKLIDLYMALARNIQKCQPALRDYYRQKEVLMAILREKVTLRSLKEIENPVIEAETKPDDQADLFMKKYGGKLNKFNDLIKKKELYRKYVNEYCEDRLDMLRRQITFDELNSFQFTKVISYLRRQFEYKYQEMVLQPLKQGGR